MDGVLNPVEVEEAIRLAVNTVAEGIGVVSGRLSAYRAAEAEYDRAFAAAYMAHEGPAHEKRYAAELGTYEARLARDTAEVGYRYAERKMRAAELTLSAYQTLAKSVAAAYGAAGVGVGS